MFITGTAMVCPVGLSAASACAARRAGISGFHHLAYRDNAGEPIVGAAVPGLDWALSATARLLKLVTRCLMDIVEGQPNIDWERVPLMVCLAEPQRPWAGADLAMSIRAHVQEMPGVRFHPQGVRLFASGHSAGFQALHAARALIGSGQAEACVVCGVDSFINAATLLWLDRDFRLKTPANRDGVIPGEAAAVVLLEATAGGDTTVEVTGLGFGLEEAPILSQEPLLGRGLALAARAALAQARIGFHDIDLRLSDVTGELYGFKELPLVEGRLMRVVRKEAQLLWHWAEAIGDTGAAAGVAQLVLADEAFRKGYAPGKHALCLTSSVAGERAVAVLRDSRYRQMHIQQGEGAEGLHGL